MKDRATTRRLRHRCVRHLRLRHLQGASAAVAAVGVLALAAGPSAAPASAAETLRGAERTALAKAAARSPGGRLVGLRVGRRGRVTMAPLHYRSPAALVAVRSSIDRGWALLVALPNRRVDHRRTFLLQRRAGAWRVRASGGRGDEGPMICARRTPRTAVVLDLGLPASVFSGSCRHPRERGRLVRPMTAGELASVRRMVEWRWSEVTGMLEPGPVQPAVSEVQTSDCAWDGRGKAVDPPSGEVARGNPAWGTVTVTCVIGSDGFGLLESPTTLLVGRSGRSGAFTRVPAHTMPSWSVRGNTCSKRQRWPVPAAPRVALAFCTPFPYVIRDALL